MTTDNLCSQCGQTTNLPWGKVATMHHFPSDAEDHLSSYVSQELAAMRQSWSDLIRTAVPCPIWTWMDVAETLLGMTATPVEELVMKGGLSGLIKQAPFKPPELVLEEIIRLALVAQDLGFQRCARELMEAEMT